MGYPGLGFIWRVGSGWDMAKWDMVFWCACDRFFNMSLSYDFRSIIASLAGALVREISRAAHPAWWTCMNFLLRFKSASCTVCGGLDDRWPSGFARRATRCRYFSHKSTYRPTGCCASELRGKGHTACACTLGTILELRLAPELYRQFGLALVSLVALPYVGTTL